MRITSSARHTLFIFIAIFLLISSACVKKESKLSGGNRGSGALPIEAMVISSRPIENRINATGTLLSNEEVELMPETSGRVVGVYFEEGKRVKKGDLLVKLNDSELQAELKRNKLQEELAADEEKRKRSLFQINGISQDEYDKALNALHTVQAEGEVIRSQINETEIIAPFDGIIGLRYISPGSVINTSTLIATLQNVNPMKVEFSIPEKYAGQIKPGTEITVQSGESDMKRQGEVYAVEAKVDPATRTIKCRATIPNPEGALIPGSFSRVEISLARFREAIVIPTEALIQKLEGESVFICENGQARSVSITTGIRTDRDVQVLEGLKFGDTLAVTGLLQLGEGKPIRITSLRDN